MSYLEQYDSIPMERAAEKVKLALGWIRTDWQEFFKELRKNALFFKFPNLLLLLNLKTYKRFYPEKKFSRLDFINLKWILW